MTLVRLCLGLTQTEHTSYALSEKQTRSYILRTDTPNQAPLAHVITQLQPFLLLSFHFYHKPKQQLFRFC